MRKFDRYALIIFASACVAQGQDSSLTLDEILETVLEFNPELKAASREIDMRKGDLLQATLRINPEIEIESEGGAENESTLLLQQTILTAGKRRKSMEVATLRWDKAKISYRIKMLDVIQRAKFAFITILADQQTKAILAQQVDLAHEFLSSAESKVKAGGSSPAEVARARVFLANSRLHLLQNERVLEGDLQQLAGFWGGHRLDFDTITGTLDTQLVSIETLMLEPYIQRAPLVLLANKEMQIRGSSYTFEKAQQVPNLSLGGGIKRVDQVGSFPAISLSMPLPIFNRNQGAIAKAAAGQLQALDEKEIAETQVTTTVHTIAVRLQKAYEEATAIQDLIMPEAESAYRTIKDGYLSGIFSYLEVTDAQTTLFDAQVTLLSAIVEYQQAAAEIEGLLGEPLKSIIENSMKGN